MNEHEQNDELAAPPKLIEALRKAQKAHVLVPPQVDDAILKAAEKHLQSQQGKKITWLRPVLWTAAAACVAVTTLLLSPNRSGDKERLAKDINHDGQVNILD